MTIKPICFVLMLSFTTVFVFTDGSGIVYQPYILSAAIPVIHIEDLKSIVDTEKPDAELGNQLLQFGDEFKTLIPQARALIAKMSVGVEWAEHLYPRIITAGVRLKDGRSNPTFRRSVSEELSSFLDFGNDFSDEMRKVLDDSEPVIENGKKFSDVLKRRRINEDTDKSLT